MSDMRPITGVLQTSLERECSSYFRCLLTVFLIRFSRRFSLTTRPDVVGQVFVVKGPGTQWTWTLIRLSYTRHTPSYQRGA